MVKFSMNNSIYDSLAEELNIDRKTVKLAVQLLKCGGRPSFITVAEINYIKTRIQDNSK